MSRSKFVPAILILGLLLSACSTLGTQGPRQIAVQPQSETLIYPSLPYGQFVYNASMVIEVSDPEEAATDAESIALRYGGYLVRSTSHWQQEGEGWTSLTLAVPASNYPAVYADLIALGDLISAVTSGEWVSDGYGREAFSEIVVIFQPGGWQWPGIVIGQWNPGRTFSQAFRVFTAIFGFLADVIIWVVVVAGPFLLIGLGLRAIWRRFGR